MRLLALNAGSSTLKYSVYAADSGGIAVVEERTLRLQPHWDARQELDRIWPVASPPDAPLAGAGHRIVFGGPVNDRPALATAERLRELEGYVGLVPLHLPGELALVREIERRQPELPQILCFDTAFHRAMPEIAKALPLPGDLDPLLQRYGFHGLSYEYVGRQCGGPPGRAVIAHLGSGASLCALRDGAPLDTTMGFSALGGLMMGTRPGDLDPGVLLRLLQRDGYDASRLSHLLEERSGLLGVSGTTSDMRALLERAAADPAANRAVSLFSYQLAKHLGALVAVLGGLDRLIFTGGIGENAPSIRAAACASLAHLGLEIDAAANAANAAVISSAASRIETKVVPTDENFAIARHIVAFLSPEVPRSAVE